MMKKGINLFLILGLLLCFLPVKVFAEATYYLFESTETPVFRQLGNYPQTWYLNVYDNSSEVRLVYVGSPYVYGYAVSLSNFSLQYRAPRDNGTFNDWHNGTVNNYNLNGVTIYYCNWLGGFNINNHEFYDYPINTTLVPLPSGINANTFGQIPYNAYYYTFGEGAEEPAPVINWGDLKDVGFHTKFTNSQQSNISQMRLNRDVIAWNQYQDTNGNDLNDINLRVDIQCAVVDYEASLQVDLLNQTIADMNISNWTELVSISPNVGKYEISWEEVAQTLWGTNNVGNDFWTSLMTGFSSAQGYYYKNGWIYRIRLRTYDNSYVSQWQTIYNVTSAPPSDSDKVYTNYYIYNYQVPNEETYQVLQTINQYNNTENNWYINDQPFGPEENNDIDMSWLGKLIEAIITLANSILSFLGNLIHDLLSLFTFDSFSLPDWDLNVQNTIDNTGMFGEAVEFTSDLQETITGVEYVQPVLYYPGFELMGVELISELTINLNDYVASEDLADLKATAYLVTDGFIYLSLLLLIKNKIMGVFKK